MKPMPEDWDRAVAVVAHPDDLEYGVGNALMNSGPDLVCEVKNSIDVRLITHDAGEHHGWA